MANCENHSSGPVRNIHSETDSFVELLEENGLLKEFFSCTPEEARARSEAVSAVCVGDFKYEGKTSDFVIPSAACNGGIPITVYTPAMLGMKPAVLVYFHGVGMTWGSRKTGSQICGSVAQNACCIVVNVEYRTPPEHKLPDSIDDAVCAVRWVIFNKGLLGARHNSSVGVMGDSGGGLIAAQVAQELDQISFQILVYPKLNLSTESPSYILAQNEGPLCTVADIHRFVKEAVHEDASPKLLQRCNPGHRINCSNLPAALFIIAEYDPTKDDAHDYIKKLKEYNVKTTTVTVKGTYHGFFHMPGHFKQCCEKAVARVCDIIKAHSDYNHLQLLN